MKIAILTTGRFHLCDLARELDHIGHDVAFYSLVPPWRTRKFGLPSRCNRWLMPWVAPAYLLSRALVGTRAEITTSDLLASAVDAVASMAVRRCDVVIAISGIFDESLQRCRGRFGARILVERGSRHILSQRDILESMPGRPRGMPVPDSHVRRELRNYDLADAVVVPSRHVVDSFRDNGVGPNRMFRNPYGVDLDLFPMTKAPAGGPTVVMAGSWSLQKGCDILGRACAGLPQTRLVHVGSIADAPVPQGLRWVHHEPVDQGELTKYYAQGHVFGLPSRQDGFGMVLAQALASGLTVVCSDRTGGEDLAELLDLGPDVVSVVPTEDEPAFTDALRHQLGLSLSIRGTRDLLGEARPMLSWKEYGARYDKFLRDL